MKNTAFSVLLLSGILSLFVSLTAVASPGADDQDTLDLSLRQAAMEGVIPRIERLIRRGANVNAQAPHGESALEYAILFGRYKAALRLLELGADPNIEDDTGTSPLLRAATECNASRVVDALLRSGAEVNHQDLYGRTALIDAAHADCVRTVAVLLLEAKDEIEIDAEDDAQESASSLSRQDQIPEMLELAIKYQQVGDQELLNRVREQMR